MRDLQVFLSLQGLPCSEEALSQRDRGCNCPLPHIWGLLHSVNEGLVLYVHSDLWVENMADIYSLRCSL